MTDNSSSILNLVSAMERAKAQGRTDDDQSKSDLQAAVIRKLGHDIIDLVVATTPENGGPLGHYQALETMAAILGTMILSSTDSGHKRRIAATMLAALVLRTATREED